MNSAAGRYPSLIDGYRSRSLGTNGGGVPQRPWILADARGEYSRKVPQQARKDTDPGTRSGTVTRADGRGWTCCLLMACKRPGVRVPLAPRKIPGQSVVLALRLNVEDRLTVI